MTISSQHPFISRDGSDGDSSLQLPSVIMKAFFHGLLSMREIGTTEFASRLEAAAQRAVALNEEWFGITRDSQRPFELIFAPISTLFFDPFRKIYMIYIRENYMAEEQMFASVYHEMYHRVTHFHELLRKSLWIDEMIAYLSTQHALEIHGMGHHAQERSMGYRRSPTRLSILELRRLRRKPYFIALSKPRYPAGFGASVAHLGETLEEIVGWDAMCQIVRYRSITEWVENLPEKQQRQVSALLS